MCFHAFRNVPGAAALAPRPPARYEMRENTMFGSKSFKFIGFSEKLENVAFRVGGVANVISFRGMF